MGVRTWAGAATALAAAGALAGCADMGMGVPPRAGAVAAAARCGDERFPIYFDRGSAELPQAAREVIRTAAGRIAGCRITAVDVVGMAMAEAGAPADPTLTQRRSDNVAQALAAAGLPTPTFDVQTAAVGRPATGARTPMARRTEVVLHAQPATT